MSARDGARHPPSLWAATAVPPPPCRPLAEDMQAEVAIIGGGFTGLSAALHLAEAGREVVLLEAEAIGWGASGRNGGQVNPGARVDRAGLVRRFGESAGGALHAVFDGAPDFLFALIERLSLACDPLRPGGFKLAHSQHALAGLAASAETLKQAGVEAKLLRGEALFEAVGTRRYLGGLFDPRMGSVQPLSLARELARSAIAKGAHLHEGTRATALRHRGDLWEVETDTGATVRARQVIVATNAYTDDLLPGLKRTILPVNSFQIATEPLPAETAHRVLPHNRTAADSRRLVLYFRKDRDQRFVLGGRASFRSSADTTRGDYDVLRRVLADLFPPLGGCRIAHRWTGLVGVTADRLPHFHTPAEGLTVALGYNGRGVALSVTVGALLAEGIANRSLSLPVTPIRPMPLHGLRTPVLHLVMLYNQVMDRLGR